MRKWLERGYLSLTGSLILGLMFVGGLYLGINGLRETYAKPIISKKITFPNIETGIADVKSTVYLEQEAIPRYTELAKRTMLVEKHENSTKIDELWVYFEVPGRPNIFAARIYKYGEDIHYRLRDYTVVNGKVIEEHYEPYVADGLIFGVVMMLIVFASFTIGLAFDARAKRYHYDFHHHK